MKKDPTPTLFLLCMEKRTFLETQLLPYAKELKRDSTIDIIQRVLDLDAYERWERSHLNSVIKDYKEWLKTKARTNRQTLTESQAHFIKTKLLPFARNLGHQEDFVKTIEMVLFKKEYDKVDKIIINFLTDKMKELEP